jgi:autotransporter-associated beta strand protein
MQMGINSGKTAIAAAVSLVVVGISLSVSSAWATQVEIGAEQDATLLGGNDALTNNSLADPGIFVGTDGEGNPKRGLIEFNIAAAVPTGATITGVQLQLTVGQVAGSGGGSPGGTNAPETISLFDETQAWGQPTNFAGATTFGGHGHGAMPDPGDATWNYAFYNTTPWTVAGGDWTSSLPDVADASVTGTLASFTWSSAAMVTDVQNWLNSPSANFGWILKNADETDPTDFRAFWSAQGAAANNNPAIAPQLTVTYVAAPPPTAYWSGAQSGAAGLIWSTQLGSSGNPNTNWSATDGGADLHEIPGGGVTNVIFGAAGNSAGSLSTTLGADFSIDSLTFASARTNSVIIGGASTLTLLSGGITVQSGSGAHTINATGDTTAGTPGIVLGASQTWTNNSSNTLTIQSSIGDAGAGNSLTIAGSGVIEFAAANTYTGGTTVSGGTLVASVSNAIPSHTALSIGRTGTVVLATNTGLATLSSLSIAGAGTLDITNNHVIMDYAPGMQAAADADIRNYLIAGRNGGSWNGTGGIDSSIAAANPAQYAVGYADGADGVVAGLSAGQIEIKYTLLGDANLDGVVSGDDFSILAGNLGKAVAGWDKGDFLYSGLVNGDDFAALVGNLGRSANGADVALPEADYAAIDEFAAANGLLADVPEPSALLLIAIGMPISFCLLRRRQVNGTRASAMPSI